MRNAYPSVAVIAMCLCMLWPARTNAQGRTRVVAADGRASSVSCEAANPAPRSIQAAIDLSQSGDRILVCPGVYEEQLRIAAKELTIRGVSSGDLHQVLIKPRGVVVNSTNAFSGAPVAAIVAVEDSASVVLRDLTIDGADNRLADCAAALIGVFYRNASGVVQTVVVKDVRLGAGLERCDSGFGIFAQSGAGLIASVSVSDSSIHGYQKTGIVGNEAGTSLHVTGSTMSGDGVTTAIAQNGVQVGFGATGQIAKNSIVNHVYTCPTFPCDASSSILVFESSQVKVTGNRTAKAVVGIYLVGSDESEVRNNRVSDSEVFDGIVVIGSRNRVHGNRIVNSDEFAIAVDGDGNRIEDNVINEAPCGIFSHGVRNRLLRNTISNTELATCEPFSLARRALSLDAQEQSGLSSSGRGGATLGTALRDGSGVVLRAPAPTR